MSAVPETLSGGALHEPPPHGEPVVRSGLPRAARIYLVFLGLVTVAAAGEFYLRAPAIRKGRTLIVGFDAATYERVLG